MTFAVDRLILRRLFRRPAPLAPALTDAAEALLEEQHASIVGFVACAGPEIQPARSARAQRVGEGCQSNDRSGRILMLRTSADVERGRDLTRQLHQEDRR